MSADEDDGYVSPEFDLPSDSEDEPHPPPSKRVKSSGDGNRNKKRSGDSLEDYEQMALKMLRGS